MKKYIIRAELLMAMLFAFSTIIAQNNPIGSPSSEYFNPKTDIYMSNFFANVIEFNCIPAGSPNYLNNYACIGRFKNSGVRNDYTFSSEIINKLVGYFKSQGYNDLLKIVKSYKADDGSGINRNYTEVEFKEMNAQILKMVVTLLSSFGKGEQYESYLKTFFRSDMCTYGFVDVNGKIIIMPEYDNVGNFNDGLVRVEQKNLNGVEKAGFLNESGKVVIPLIYGKYSGNFSEGLCSVQNENGKKGYIDKTGKLVIPFQYDIAGDFKNGIAEVKKDENKPLSKINKKGVLSTTNDNIKNKVADNSMLKNSNGLTNKFPNSRLSEITVGNYTIKRVIQEAYESIYTSINSKNLLGLSPSKSEIQKNLNEANQELKKVVEEALGGPMTKAQLTEFNEIKNNSAATSDFAALLLAEMVKSGSEQTYSNSSKSNGSGSRNTNTSSEVCSYCKPYNSKGHYVQDYNVSTRTYTNGRYIIRPGYKICSSCTGTGLQSIRGPGVCNQCNGEKLKKCSNCRGSGLKN